ncbi:hypothetical protein FEM48_Zijuj08G0130700 [Ziziphus jujuba var. spinosa]|uniref:DUF4228 domain-containing protein n=1 Tax=Ziziphus jujuba var. spinosa TaxID=714518 RepID=A0A978UZ96_ZIZJJ|nr:hypothetical protein FEM48_Zijuj08G0130700 [Ziziphus jujuba var. spinosa]
MGNCQAAEAATVVIQHPGNKIERIYWSVSANQIMASNPGHYVALVVTSATMKSENGTPLKQLKLLRPDDTLLIGQVYRLISFEDVLKEFAAKRCVKLGKLLEKGALGLDPRKKDSGGSNPNPKSDHRNDYNPTKHEVHGRLGSSASGSGSRGVGRQYGVGGGQWRPALQSIAEVGT